MKVISIFAAAVCFILAGLYLTGHGPGASPGKVHTTHAVLFIVIGLLSLVWMRFQNNSVDNT